VFLKRHRIPKEHTNGEYFGMADLNIGAQVTFYARTFFVVSCDPFTRQFLSNSGMEVGEEMGYPDDPIDMFRTSRKSTKALAPPNPRSDDLARYSEAKLGKATNAINTDKLKQFMENDRKVCHVAPLACCYCARLHPSRDATPCHVWNSAVG